MRSTMAFRLLKSNIFLWLLLRSPLLAHLLCLAHEMGSSHLIPRSPVLTPQSHHTQGLIITWVIITEFYLWLRPLRAPDLSDQLLTWYLPSDVPKAPQKQHDQNQTPIFPPKSDSLYSKDSHLRSYYHALWQHRTLSITFVLPLSRLPPQSGRCVSIYCCF